METESLTLQDGALISSSTFGQGNAGNLIVSARDIEMIGGRMFAATAATGKGGNLKVEAESLTLRDGGQINTTTIGQGNAGDLTVSAKNIELFGGQNITDLLAEGLKITEVLGPEQWNYTGLFAGTAATGNGGDLTVEVAESLTMGGGAQIVTGTIGQGDAGDLKIYARSLTLQDKADISAAALPEAIGAAGDVIINLSLIHISEPTRP